MIARIWRGRTRTENADRYVGYVTETGVREHRRTPGNRGSWILRRGKGDTTEFVVISLWESRESIAAFAGEDIEKAVYYPEDERFLLETSETVEHYDAFPNDLT